MTKQVSSPAEQRAAVGGLVVGASIIVIVLSAICVCAGLIGAAVQAF